MSTNDPARMIREAMEAAGISRRKLGARIGVLKDGRSFDPTAIRLMVEGRRRSWDSELVTQLVRVLEVDRLHQEELIDFDADDLYEACGVWPEGFTADSIRKVRADARKSAAGQGAGTALFRGTSLLPAHRLARLPRNRPVARPAARPASRPALRLVPRAA